jgi:hypothetical protein
VPSLGAVGGRREPPTTSDDVQEPEDSYDEAFSVGSTQPLKAAETKLSLTKYKWKTGEKYLMLPQKV